MELRLVKHERGCRFRWPSGNVETYEDFYRYDVAEPPAGLKGGSVCVAVGWRDAFGARRRRVVVFRNVQWALVEFVGGDDWEQTRRVVWGVKVPGGNRSARTLEDVPEEFRRFEVDRFETWVRGPRRRGGYAVCLAEDDHKGLVLVGLIREQQRRRAATRVASAAPTSAKKTRASAGVAPQLSPEYCHVVRGVAAYQERFLQEHLFAFVGRCAGRGVTDRAGALGALSEPSVSLAMLLGFHAFARQGGQRAGYNEICLELLRGYVNAAPEALWDDYPEWEVVYGAFEAGCKGRGIKPNEGFNRGLIRDIYGLAARTPGRGVFAVWGSDIRDRQSVAELHVALRGVRGIGPKIAAFVCRDTTFLADVERVLAHEEHWRLQPVDVWIGRIARFLRGETGSAGKSARVVAEFLADACSQAGVSNAAFNQGGWYLGSQVARSAARLEGLLNEMLLGGGP